LDPATKTEQDQFALGVAQPLRTEANWTDPNGAERSGAEWSRALDRLLLL